MTAASPVPVDPAAALRLFEASLDCVKVLDLTGALVSMNRNGEHILELDSFDSICGLPWDALWPPEAKAQIREAIETARSGQADRFTAFCPTAKGSPRWWDVTVAPVVSPEGALLSFLSVSRDVTDLHLARREQEQLAKRLRRVMEAAGIGDWSYDPATDEVHASPQADRCLDGEGAGTVRWQALAERIHPDDLPGVRAALERTLDEGVELRHEARVRWRDGSEHWLEITGTREERDDGVHGWHIAGTVREITRRKTAELELQNASDASARLAEAARREKQRVNALLEAAPVGIGYADATGKLLLVNAANRAIWGEHPYSANVDEYVEWKGWWADGSERHGQPLQPHDWGLARALEGHEVRSDLIEIEPFGAPRTRRTVLLRAVPIRDPDGTVAGGVVVQVDLTDQVRAEAQLRASEAKFRTIADAMPQMVWSTLPDGYHDYYNQQWYDFTGTSVGSTDGEAWNGLFHPEDQDRAWAIWRNSLATGETYEIEYRLRHHTGAYRWVLGRALPVRDEAGRIVRWMGTCTDIHEHRLILDALAEREGALRLADRRKNEFLAMLAHELRNPLAPIATGAQLLTVPGIKPGQIAQSSAIIGRQVRHMTSLIDDLLDVSRVTRGLVSLERAVFDLRDAVRAAIEQVRPLIEERQHALTTRIGAKSIWVDGDRTRLTQVVANLLNNAAKYTPSGGEIGIDLRAAGDAARLMVSDNGMGIDATLLPDVFELFTQGERTPDRSQGGLGIGLALVRSLIELHGGQVKAESAGPGQGSVFSLQLPLSPSPGVEAVAAASAPPAVARCLDVVVVDDNVDAGQTIATLLEVHGHRTRVFEGADGVLTTAQSAPADAYILDIGLPGISGHELAQRLRETPATHGALLVALSGYGGDKARALSLDAGFDEHLVKPVDPARLVAVLEGGRQATS